MHEPTPIILRRIQSPQHWLRFWLEKLEREVKKQGLADERVRAYSAVIREFLTLNPGNPRAIAADKVEQFALDHQGGANEALQFFYQHVSYSLDIQTRLTECASRVAASPETPHAAVAAKPAVATARPAVKKKAAAKAVAPKACAKPKSATKAAGARTRKKS